MKYDKELIKIIEDKNFKTFWHCLDYLLNAGYSPIDAFGISIKQFGENKIFSSVAFIRMETWQKHIMHSLQAFNPNNPSRRPSMIIGIIDDTNIHLDGIYTLYRKMLQSNNSTITESDIEETCEVIKISQLSPFIINYILEVSVKHFGIESFVIPTYIETPNQEYRDGLIGQIGRQAYEDNNTNRYPPNHEPRIVNFSEEITKWHNRPR